MAENSKNPSSQSDNLAQGLYLWTISKHSKIPMVYSTGIFLY